MKRESTGCFGEGKGREGKGGKGGKETDNLAW